MRPEVFQEKYLPLTPSLFKVAMNILNNQQDAEDAVQETFLRVWGRAERVDRMEKPESFFFTILRNICVDVLRRRQYDAGEEAMQDVADAAKEYGEGEEPGMLRRLLRTLTPRARKVITLRHIGEYSTRDIAKLTGDSETSVRAMLSRARHQLRDEYLKAAGRLSETPEK